MRFRFEFGRQRVPLCLSHSVLSRLLIWLTSRLGRTQPSSPLELYRRPGYELVKKNWFRLGILNLVWISVLSTYRNVCLSECFGGTSMIRSGSWRRGRGVWGGAGGGCLLPVIWVCYLSVWLSYKFMLCHDVCICRVEEISLCKRRTIVIILWLLFKHWLLCF